MYRRLESLSAEKNVQTSTEISVLCSFLVSCTVVRRKFYTRYVMAILVYDFLSTLYADPTPKPVLLRARGLTLFGSFTLRGGLLCLKSHQKQNETHQNKWTPPFWQQLNSFLEQWCMIQCLLCCEPGRFFFPFPGDISASEKIYWRSIENEKTWILNQYKIIQFQLTAWTKS